MQYEKDPVFDADISDARVALLVFIPPLALLRAYSCTTPQPLWRKFESLDKK